MAGPVFAFWRLWFGTLLFGGALLVRRRLGISSLSKPRWRWGVLGGLWFGTNHLLYVGAIKATSVVDVSLINRLAPVMVGVVAIRLFNERPGPGFVAGGVIGIAGAAIVVLSGSSGAEGDPVGMMLAVGATAGFAGFLIVSKLGREHIDIIPFLFATMGVGALLNTGFVLATSQSVGSVKATDILLIAAVATIPGGLGHLAMTKALKFVPMNLPPVLMLAIPILSGSLAWLFLDEGIDTTQVVGGLVTLAGVGLAVLSPAGKRLMAQAQPNTAAN